VPPDEAEKICNEKRLRSLGIARARGPEYPVEPVRSLGLQENGAKLSSLVVIVRVRRE
jgi:hypothetical protein